MTLEQEDRKSADRVTRVHVTVTGRVQGVYFRAETQREARALGIAGWVRNSGDNVEAVFEGSPGAIEHITGWCHEGPPRAAVTHVDITQEEPQGLSGFKILSSL